MAASGLALIMASVALLYFDSMKERSALVQEMTILATIIGDRSAAAIIYDDGDMAVENLQSVLVRESIVAACIHTSADGLFAEVTRSGDTGPCPISPPNDGYKFGEDESSASEGFTIVQPIYLDNERIGTLSLFSDMSETRARAAQSYVVLAIILMSAVAIVFTLTFRLQRIISEPVNELVKVAKNISVDRDFSVRADKFSDDELGQLVDAFNDMVQTIQEQNQELVAAKEGLEATVHERTEDLRRREDDLRETNLDLERSNRDLEQFAYVASHDLQEPLRMVSSYLQLLAQRYTGKLDEDADEFISYAVDGAQRMKKMIQDLLTYSRVGSKRGTPFMSTDMEQVLADVQANLKIGIDESCALITHDELPDVVADAGQMAQLLQNLIGNALHYAGELTPAIHVAAKRSEGTRECIPFPADPGWVFAVSDNGIGIQSEHFERIFEVFQRLQTQEHSAGTGIGLAVCKKIVRQHGGRIWVESEPGRGSRFLFHLPDEVPELRLRAAVTSTAA